jgi:prolyl 4-hydroxylase
MQTTLSESWQGWIRENHDRGCSKVSMIESMVKAGIARSIAENSLRHLPEVPVKKAAPHERTHLPGAKQAGRVYPKGYVYEDAIVGRDNFVDAEGHAIDVLARYKTPEIVVFGNVLSWEECQELIVRAQPKMERSTIVNSQSGARDIIPHRTSDGTFFKRGEDDFILSIEKRLAALMNEPFEHGEGIQVLNYKVGGEYRPHYDYFPPEQPGSKVHTGESGQRVATLIVYLNDVPSGGETIFPQAGVSVLPKLGNGVYFKYMNSRQQLDSMSLHGGEPVRQGEKWIITKWVRERPFV